MMDYSQFLTLTTIALVLIISPGPDFAIVMRNSLTHGRLSGVYTAVGIAIANGCHIVVNILGVGLLIARSQLLMQTMKVGGALYLIYLGFLNLKNPSKNITSGSGSLQTIDKGFRNGFLTSVANPKACLFYLSFFSILLSPTTPWHIQAVYGAWIMCIALFWFILVAVLFTIPFFKTVFHQKQRAISCGVGVVLLAFGIKLLGEFYSFK